MLQTLLWYTVYSLAVTQAGRIITRPDDSYKIAAPTTMEPSSCFTDGIKHCGWKATLRSQQNICMHVSVVWNSMSTSSINICAGIHVYMEILYMPLTHSLHMITYIFQCWGFCRSPTRLYFLFLIDVRISMRGPVQWSALIVVSQQKGSWFESCFDRVVPAWSLQVLQEWGGGVSFIGDSQFDLGVKGCLLRMSALWYVDPASCSKSAKLRFVSQGQNFSSTCKDF